VAAARGEERQPGASPNRSLVYTHGAALDAGLALIPLALGAGEPGREIPSSLAVVVLGGLLFATALDMVVIPSPRGIPGRREAAVRRGGRTCHEPASRGLSLS
jgi:hypothetical protein